MSEQSISLSQNPNNLSQTQLLETLAKTYPVYAKIAKVLSFSKHFPPQPTYFLDQDQTTQLAANWLTPNRLAAANQLYHSKSKPLLLVPLPAQSINQRGLAEIWSQATTDDPQLWLGKVSILKKWSKFELSANNRQAPAQAVRFMIAETGFTKSSHVEPPRNPLIRSINFFEAGVMANLAHSLNLVDQSNALSSLDSYNPRQDELSRSARLRQIVAELDYFSAGSQGPLRLVLV